MLAFDGQPVEDVGDLAELLEVELAQVLLVLLLNERVSVGRQDFAQVEAVGLEELAECALLHFVLVREGHLCGQLFVLARLRLHVLYLALYLLLLVYRAIYLGSHLEVLRRRLSYRKTLGRPVHNLRFDAVYLIDELLCILEKCSLVVFMVVVEAVVDHCD